MSEPVSAGGVYLFGPFRLNPAARTLHRGTAPVSLTPRMFDLLLCLVRNAERVVDRPELMRAVWGERIVEEANLKQTVYELRRALETAPDSPLIATVPMRGYRLAVPVRLERTPAMPGISRRGLAARLPSGFRRSGIVAAGLLGAVLVALALGDALLTHKPPAPAGFVAPPHSVAVLPFSNSSGDATQNDFADGISEDLINALGRIEGLHVAARTSSFLFRGRPRAVTDIARQLNVGAVLEGSVRREGARIHINAELIDAGSGFSFWSRSYDTDGGDLLGAQTHIAEAVAASMQVALLGDPVEKLALGGTRNQAAYDAYLRGMKLLRVAENIAAIAAARAAFENAIALDPQFALARAYRAREMVLIAEDGTNMSPADIQDRLDAARQEADRALAIAPDLGVAHLALSDLFAGAQEFPEAQREMALARQYAPNDVQVLVDDVFLEVALGHAAQALQAAEEGVGLDPLAPAAYTALAYAQRTRRDYDGALASLHRARMLGAAEPDIAVMEAMVALERGDNALARQGCARGTHWMNYLCLAIVEHRLGMNAEALFHLAALRAALGANGAFQYAEVYAQWRQPNEAVKWLQAAYRLHDSGLLTIKSDKLLDPIRDTPQYAAIERQLHFPP